MPGTPARAAHGSSHAEQMIADGQRDRIANLRVRPRAPQPQPAAQHPVKPEPGPMGERSTDYIAAEYSTGQSRRRIDSALSVPCPVCAASRGSYCFEGGHGFCVERWLKGLKIADASLRPGELEVMAAAVRNAERIRRLRVREAARLEGRR